VSTKKRWINRKRSQNRKKMNLILSVIGYFLQSPPSSYRDNQGRHSSDMKSKPWRNDSGKSEWGE
jgi:hypothetical protein